MQNLPAYFITEYPPQNLAQIAPIARIPNASCVVMDGDLMFLPFKKLIEL